MKMKKFIALFIAAAMVFALSACGGSDDNASTPAASDGATQASQEQQSGSSELAGTYDITVWMPDAIVDLTKKMIDDFNASNEYGIVFNPTIEAVGEGDAATQMITDVEAGADIFNFAQDQFARLVQAGALSKLGAQAGETVSAGNDAGAVKAVTIDGELYAYPETADNTYFMYYDTSVIPEADTEDLDAIIADCEAANKYIAFQLQDSGWYAASFFFGAGCVSEWATDVDGNWSVNDDFNSDKGLIAMKGMNKLMTSPMFLNSSSAADLDAGAAVVISGTWDSTTAKSILGDKFGVTDLPQFTVDGTKYDLVSFSGYKLMGVKPQTDATKAAALHRLAQYLTSEAAQLERFEAVGWGPANTAAQASEAVQADEILGAVIKQNAHSVVQGQVHDSWWNIMKAVGEGAKNAKSDDELKTVLAQYDTAIEDLKNLSTDPIFVGAWNGWDNTDMGVALAGEGDELSITLTVEQSDYMGGRIVTCGTWETDKGAAQVTTGADLIDVAGAGDDNNIVFLAPGTYTVTLNTATGEISITQ
ncbi:MAG: extracellular solute-binding protein [Lachnospiraceae bacterium]|nr:extracellular solute-binding protein [Lachnospiraceae bacterium]